MCQRMWQSDGFIVGGIPIYNMSQDPWLARTKLDKILQKVRSEADALLSCAQNASEGWSRVQACFLVLRYSLAAKFTFFVQTIDPLVIDPYARQFDGIIQETLLKLLDIDSINAHALDQIYLPLKLRFVNFSSHQHFSSHHLCTRPPVYRLEHMI